MHQGLTLAGGMLIACSAGHQTMECKENRKFDLNHIADKLPEEAWALMKKASIERDLEDFREVRFPLPVPLASLSSLTLGQALKIYTKAVPDASFVDIEEKMRQESFNIYLIALVCPVPAMVIPPCTNSLTEPLGERDFRYHQLDQSSGQTRLYLRGRILLQSQGPARQPQGALAQFSRRQPRAPRGCRSPFRSPDPQVQ
jgi:hypothetical protein